MALLDPQDRIGERVVECVAGFGGGIKIARDDQVALQSRDRAAYGSALQHGSGRQSVPTASRRDGFITVQCGPQQIVLKRRCADRSIRCRGRLCVRAR